MDTNFEVGDLIWAKMKFYNYWPGEIIMPPNSKSSKNKKTHHVRFFGSNNHASVRNENIIKHNQKILEEYGNKRKSASFKKAVLTIIQKSEKLSSEGLSSEEGGSETPKFNDSPNSSEPKQSQGKKAKECVVHMNVGIEDNLRIRLKDIMPDIESGVASVRSSASGRLLSRENEELPETASLEDNVLKGKKIGFLSSEEEGSEFQQFDDSSNSSEPKKSHGKQASPSDPLKVDDDVSRTEVGVENCLEDILSEMIPHIEASVQSISTSGRLLLRENKEISETASLESDVLEEKTIGFLGLGNLGRYIVKVLCQSGYSVIVWNRTFDKCTPFHKQFKAEISFTPAGVVFASDIIFSCVADKDAAKDVFFGRDGVLEALKLCRGEGKGYVEMTTMDADTSRAIGEIVSRLGNRYLEAPVRESRTEDNELTLFMIAAGDASLFVECKSCLTELCKKHKYTGAEVGSASNLNTVLSTFASTIYTSLATAFGMFPPSFPDKYRERLKYCVAENDFLMKKWDEKDHVGQTIPRHIQTELDLGGQLTSSVNVPTTFINAANTPLKQYSLYQCEDREACAASEETRH